MIIGHLINSFHFSFALALVFMLNSVPLPWLSRAKNQHPHLSVGSDGLPLSGRVGCQQFLPSWVLSASLNTRSCGQASLMATDYCFLKFICVRRSFKKHFPHLSLAAPAHQTKPPIWFSTAVNFAGLISTGLQGEKQQLRGVQFSILCLAASCQTRCGLHSLLRLKFLVVFPSFWHFKCSRGPRG